jgi:hypothetical protein
MVLTDAHLDHAGTLQDWDVRRVGGHRWLVRSRNLDAWYQHDRPDPGARESARTDFASALSRPEIDTPAEGYHDTT